MKFKRYSNGTDFLCDAKEFLEKEYALNNLVLAIAENNLIVDIEKTDNHPVFITIRSDDDQSIVMAGAVTYPPSRLVIYSVNNNEKLSEFVVDNICQNDIRISGVLGPNQDVILFSEAWKKKTGRQYSVSMRERVYEIFKVNKISYSPGFLRVAKDDDVQIINGWTSVFLKEALSESKTDEEIATLVRKKIESKFLFVWEDECVVSMAACTRPTKKGISISLVFTPEIHRKRGYARSCVASLTQKKFDEGYSYCTLFTDLDNFTSNKIYKEIGYREVGDVLQINFE